MKNFLSKIKTERVYVFLILLFGMISVFVTFPLGNGDEGYHLSKSYIFDESSKINEEDSRTSTGISGNRIRRGYERF